MARVTVPLFEINQRILKRLLPKRNENTHKGDYGKILLLCGSVGFTGAAELAARAAARCGSGLLCVGVPQSVYPIVATKLTEPMVFPLPDEDGKFAASACEEVLNRLARCDACLIGCGMGQSEGTFALVKAVLSQSKCPVVLDADGINVLQGHIDVLCNAACPVVLTPHDGEFMRLGELSPNRLSAVKRMHRQSGATVLLKGHRTLVCGEGGCFINRCGNAGMATGGSGDVLAGIIVSLLGQGFSPTYAAALGAYVHGKSGDLCAKRFGQYSMLPSDMIEALHEILKS